jgi:hypothetical protein
MKGGLGILYTYCIAGSILLSLAFLFITHFSSIPVESER